MTYPQTDAAIDYADKINDLNSEIRASIAAMDRAIDLPGKAYAEAKIRYAAAYAALENFEATA